MSSKRRLRRRPVRSEMSSKSPGDGLVCRIWSHVEKTLRIDALCRNMFSGSYLRRRRNVCVCHVVHAAWRIRAIVFASKGLRIQLCVQKPTFGGAFVKTRFAKSSWHLAASAVTAIREPGEQVVGWNDSPMSSFCCCRPSEVPGFLRSPTDASTMTRRRTVSLDSRSNSCQAASQLTS